MHDGSRGLQRNAAGGAAHLLKVGFDNSSDVQHVWHDLMHGEPVGENTGLLKSDSVEEVAAHDFVMPGVAGNGDGKEAGGVEGRQVGKTGGGVQDAVHGGAGGVEPDSGVEAA